MTSVIIIITIIIITIIIYMNRTKYTKYEARELDIWI